MSNASQIAELLRRKKNCRITLPHYDGGSQAFWPEYRLSQMRAMGGDVIAFNYFYDGDIAFGSVRKREADVISLTLIPRSTETNPTQHVAINASKVVAIMHPI